MPKIFSILVSMKHICEENELNLVWIPGHEGFLGNDRADKLEKRCVGMSVTNFLYGVRN